MKTTFTTQTTQRNAASTLHASHSTHTAYSPLRRLTLLVTLLMTFALGARAESYYVFTYTYGNNTYFLGQETTPTTDFVPNASIYLGTSGSTFRNANNYYIRYNSGLKFDTTTGTDLTINNNDYLTYRSGNSTYYLNMNRPDKSNRAWRMSNDDNRATAYPVTTSSVINNFTISGDATIKAVGAYNYTHTNATYYDTYEFNNKKYYSTNASQAATTTEPTNNLPAVTNGYTWTIENNSYATVNASTGAITVNSLPATATEVTLTCSVSRNGVTKTATKKITLQQSGNTPTAITASDFSLGVGTDDDISYTLTGTAPIYDKVEATSGNTGIFTVVTSPTSGGKVTLHPVAMGNATLTLIAKAKDGTTNACSTTVNITVAEKVKTPTIEYEPNGAKAWATITCATEGAIIYYTIDGSEPTTSSTIYESRFEVAEKATVKAMAVKSGYLNSNVASRTYEISKPTGVDGGVVTLNDLEDHNWTYYSGVNESVDGGNYNTQYAGKLYSPNPRNVKITYNANGGAVSIDESETSFVYFKTLEQGATAGQYPYTVISNPFSKRPTGKGFGGWKIISGGEYINGYNNGSTLPLDQEITFVNLPYPSTNCISAEIVLEATWVNAKVTYLATVNNSNNNYTFNITNGSSTTTYENNFLVINRSYSGTLTLSQPVTIMMVEPNGIGTDPDYRDNYTFTGDITPNNTGVTKIEFAKWESSKTITADYHNLWIGRGVAASGTNNCASLINGGSTTSTESPRFHVKVESGKYNYMSLLSGYYTNSGGNGGSGFSITGTKTNAKITLGNDYDRAKGDNTALQFVYGISMGRSGSFSNSGNRDNTQVLDFTIKSGRIGYTFFMENTESTNYLQGGAGYCIYLSSGGSQTNVGTRNVLIEGGDICTIGSGIDSYNNAPSNSTTASTTTNYNRLGFNVRIKGGTIHGNVYGGAAKSPAGGNRVMIMTGGQVKGWFAAGCNGTDDAGGQTYGTSYVYIGGTAKVDSEGSTKTLGYANGGNVYAAGAGRQNSTTCGEMTFGTNLVIADKSYIERGAYGGGNYGYAATSSSTKIYVTGGINEGNNGTVNSVTTKGGVYGGANQQNGPNVGIYMTGGEMRGGLYGGSNTTGTISGNVTMQIHGGQVGTSEKTANIHGGGYGNSTTVSGNVNMTIGESASVTDWVKVYGNVYGGSALGTVSGNAAITMNKGEINGNLFGGALGNDTYAAQVNGNVVVTVNGGKVTGAVFGCNDANGTPKGTVSVTVNGTDATTFDGSGNRIYALQGVYGGGNLAHYNPTTDTNFPKVVVNNCLTSIKEVYGGGNAAAVPQTDVTIYGGDIGRVFAGGNGISGTPANVGYQNKLEQTTANSYGNGTATAKIYGGTIGQVFGGSNAHGVIRNDVSVTIDKNQSTANPRCDMIVGEVYGGGNMAKSKAASVTIGCTGTLTESHNENPEYIGVSLEGIGSVFGGANQADVTSGNITVKINSGIVANVFGGNNQTGNISGSINVNIEKSSESEDCGWYVGNVFGGGNLAQYVGDPAVNILNGKVSGNVYGGGKGDANDHSKGQVTGNPTVTIGDNANADHMAIVIGDVYGGGDAGNVEGIPVVNVVNKCNTSIGNVYGGGNAADVNGTDVNIDGGTINGMVFGGGHGDKNADPQTEANVNGNVNVDITGGTINKVFGGSNSKGNISGTISLKINKGDTSCDMHIGEVYGGGNEAAGNAGTITIGCTGGEGEGIADVYGGANAADINSGITLNITGGNISRVFGGNNTSGSINGDIQVNVDWTGTCGVNALGNVYGAGNQAAYTGNTKVNILNGTVTGSVYGGGLGATAVVTGTTKVNIDGSADGHSVAVTQNVLGGGDAAAVTGSTDVNIINGAVSGSVFGGGNAAGVSENGVVDVTGGTIASGVYGGSNASGTVGNTTVTLANGTIGTDAAHANVHGGGYGKETKVSGDVAVNIQGGTIYGDVYGGSALGTVNTDANNTTAVNLTGGIIHGDAYGGGLGDSDTAADVNGNVTVTLNGTAFTLATTTDDSDNIIPTSGRVFGCNNINGSPKGTVLVKVLKTVARDGEGNVKAKPTPNSGVYELQAVYGGGNLAAYNPTDPEADGQFTSYTWGEENVAHVNTKKPVQVVIDGCGYTSIEYVYGGGNAAATPATDVTVLGSYEIGSVFGGGNGKDKYTLDGGTTWKENLGADVGIIDAAAYATDKSGKYGTGNAMTSVLGGTVHNIFGGSNTLGNIVGEATAYLDAASDCELKVDGIYGGGNEAYMDGSSGIQLGCISYLKEIYGGARNADVGGDINLTITSGHFDRVFGGNNLGGAIKGSITVTIEETGCNPITIGELYGGGNLAAYSVYGYDAEGNYKTSGTKLYNDPVVNILSFSSIGRVFGGGLGNKAVMVGSPTVNINENVGAKANNTEWSYLGQTISYTDGSSITLPTRNSGSIGAIGTVFGGGNAAPVIGNTQVNIGTTTGKADIRGNVYGGGNQAKVTGKTNVVIGQGN